MNCNLCANHIVLCVCMCLHADEKSSPENDVIIVSGESSQDEVSPSKFRVENEESPGVCVCVQLVAQ